MLSGVDLRTTAHRTKKAPKRPLLDSPAAAAAIGLAQDNAWPTDADFDAFGADQRAPARMAPLGAFTVAARTNVLAEFAFVAP